MLSAALYVGVYALAASLPPLTIVTVAVMLGWLALLLYAVGAHLACAYLALVLGLADVFLSSSGVAAPPTKNYASMLQLKASIDLWASMACVCMAAVTVFADLSRDREHA